jgi:hypothetical protein
MSAYRMFFSKEGDRSNGPHTQQGSSLEILSWALLLMVLQGLKGSKQIMKLSLSASIGDDNEPYNST